MRKKRILSVTQEGWRLPLPSVAAVREAEKSISLERARLCCRCWAIFEAPRSACPDCKGGAWAPLEQAVALSARQALSRGPRQQEGLLERVLGYLKAWRRRRLEARLAADLRSRELGSRRVILRMFDTHEPNVPIYQPRYWELLRRNRRAEKNEI